MNALIWQWVQYAIAMLLTFFGVALIQRGFFLKYLKVRASMGRLVLVKVRSRLRDYFECGWVDGPFLIWKHGKATNHLFLQTGKIVPESEVAAVRAGAPAVRDRDYFYRAIGVSWIDVDEEKGAAAKTDYSAVTGHDMEAEDNMLKRALTRPAQLSKIEKIIMFCLIIMALVLIFTAYHAYKSYQLEKQTLQAIGLLGDALKGAGTVTPGPGV